MIFRAATPLMTLFVVAGFTSSLAEISSRLALAEIGETPPCESELTALWNDEVSKEVAVRVAVETKESTQEVCRLFGELLEAEAKLAKYVEMNAGKCGIPDADVKQLKVEHEIRAAVVQRTCAAAHE